MVATIVGRNNVNLTPRFDTALAAARSALLDARVTGGCWEGRLSGDVFSTAAAITALRQLEEYRPQFGVARIPPKIAAGLAWLASRQNADGGWGAADGSCLATSAAWAVLRYEQNRDPKLKTACESAEAWLKKRLNGAALTPAGLAPVLARECADDPALLSGALAMCALAGGLAKDDAAWKPIPALAFEALAYAEGRMPSIYSAPPTRIAVGHLLHFRCPSGNVIRKLLRNATRSRTLRKLEGMLSEEGGYFEHIPTTAFVLMSLLECGHLSSPVLRPCEQFLMQAQHADGAWPVAGDLSIRLTSLALDALASPHFGLRANESHAWLLEQQDQRPALGGWSWAGGGLPTCEDTAGALLALRRVQNAIAVCRCEARQDAVTAGIRWLAARQNGDGSFAAFGKSGGKSALDCGAPEITAQVIRALLAWRPELPSMRETVDPILKRAQEFLRASQQPDGSWKSAWFGAEGAPDGQNALYATSRVVLAIAELGGAKNPDWTQPLQRAVLWLQDARRPQGGWTARAEGTPSIEESAWAVEALAAASATLGIDLSPGVEFLLAAIESGAWRAPAPLGLFFARHWYSEELYPVVYAVSALARVERVLRPEPVPTVHTEPPHPRHGKPPASKPPVPSTPLPDALSSF